ncbi:MAG: DUF2188 domain-containing protein [Anaerolineae bacterium]|nr:DUF2188 domain-containing protein [Anaerolineae bacterium]
MTRNSHHVVPALNGGWIVRRGGSDRASKHFNTQKDAVDWARKVSINQNSELVIHKRDGTILEKNSFSPFPTPFDK